MTVVDGWYSYPGTDAGWKVDVDFGDGWEPVTEWVAGIARQSGRRGPLDRFLASTLTVTLRNDDRDFSPWRVGTFGRPTRNMPIRWTARDGLGLEVVRFLGWIDRWVERATPAATAPSKVALSTVTVVATDGFKRLARANGLGTTPAGAGELSGARMDRILTAAGWTGEVFLDDGEATMAETDLSRRALDELHDTALAEGGVFFISGPGVATFFDRASITASLDPVVRFGNDGGDGSVTYGELSIADTDEAVINTVRVARAGGTAYTAVDSGGVTLDGQQLFSRTDLPLEDDPQAEALAAVLLSRAVNASFVVGPLTIEPITGGPAAWAAAVSLGVTNPVSIAHADSDVAGGFTLLARIDGITDQVAPGRWTTTYTVSALDEPESYEVIGPPYDLTASTSWDSITWGWTIPGHGFDALFVSFDGEPWVEIPGDSDTYWTGSLEPDTSHTFQIRGRKGLVDTGVVSLTASTAEAPLFPDPDEDGEMLVPDPGSGCEWRWHLYELDATLGVTSLSSGTFASMVGDYWRPTYSYEALTWYRIIWQKWCGSPKAQVGDDIVYDWQEPADWGDPCVFGTPPTPTPVFALEVCGPTQSIQDAVTNFPMVERELFQSSRPGPLETDIGVLCGPGFDPAPIASGYLVDAATLGVQETIVEPPQFTLGVWVNFDSEPTSVCPILEVGGGGEISLRAFADTVDVGRVRFGLSIRNSLGGITWHVFGTAGDEDDSVEIAGWHTVAVTYGWEGSNAKARLYLDGLPTGDVIDLTGDWPVRAHDSLVTWGGEPNSSFAHPAGWDSVLSAEDIETIFSPPAPPLTYDELVLSRNPVAFWPCTEKTAVTQAYDTKVLAHAPKAYWPLNDEDSGPVFTDEANTYDIAIGSGADWSQTAGLPNGENYSAADGSIADCYVSSAGSAFNLNSGAWTIEFWWEYTAAKTTEERVFELANSGGSTVTWGVGFDDLERLDFFTLQSGGSVYMRRISGVLTANTWYHVVIAIPASSTPIIYLNHASSSASSTARTGTARTPSGSDRLYFGSKGNGTGDMLSSQRIAKAAIYDRLLTAAEQLEHYAELRGS